MNFRRYLKTVRIPGALPVPAAQVILLAVLFLGVVTFLAGPPRLGVAIPRAVTSDIVNDENVTVIITAENTMYFNAKVITIGELREFLGRPYNKKRPVLIKVDRRASLGSVVDVWNLGRDLGIERINIAADREL